MKVDLTDYFNLCNLPLTGKQFLFADDTATVFCGGTRNDVFHNVKSELSVLKKWFDANCLMMSLNKTYYLPIALKAASDQPAHLSLMLHTYHQ